MPLTTQRFRNTWAVVHVDSAWRFIDCHWGARHVTNCQDEENSAFCYELDEFFFLTDPEEHIYMHYPDEEEWQLMEKPVTQEEFIGLPILKSQFFLYGLQLPANCQAVVETDTGKVEISLHSTEEVSLHINTLRPRQDGRHFADDIFKCIFLYENVWLAIKLSLKFVPDGPINTIPESVQIMAWRRTGDKPLSEPMMIYFLTHICASMS